MGNSGAPGSGTQQLALSTAADCAEAMEEARRVADEKRTKPKSERPNTISVLRMRATKNMVSGGNQGGNIAEVQKMAESFRPNDHNCKCAELNCISKAITRLIHPDAAASAGRPRAVIATVNVRGPNEEGDDHGRRKEACSVCKLVLAEYGITEC